MSSSLPPISESLIPADVRSQGTKAVSLYDTALNFEGLLDQQLTQSLTDTLDPTDSGDDSDSDSDDGQTPDAGTSLMLQMLPGELSQALVADGGLGLAPELYRALGGTTGTDSTNATSTPGALDSSGTKTAAEPTAGAGASGGSAS